MDIPCQSLQIFIEAQQEILSLNDYYNQVMDKPSDFRFSDRESFKHLERCREELVEQLTLFKIQEEQLLCEKYRNRLTEELGAQLNDTMTNIRSVEIFLSSLEGMILKLEARRSKLLKIILP